MVLYPPTTEKVEREAKSYVATDKALAQVMDFYAEAYNLQRKVAAESSDMAEFSTIAHTEVEKPFLAGKAVPIDSSTLGELLQKMVEIIESYFPGEHKGVLSQLGAQLSAEDVSEFFGQAEKMSSVEIAKFLDDKGIDAEEKEVLDKAVLAIRMSVAPFYAKIAQAAEEKDWFKLWDKGSCPVCGERPSMAVLRDEDGARLLSCGLCHASWEFSRSICPSCLNDNQEQLKFFFLPQQEARRVYVCDKCKYYTKTTVLKELGKDVVPELENVSTYYLDILAEEEGYGFFEMGKHVC